MITSVDFIITFTLSPFFILRSSTASFVITDVTIAGASTFTFTFAVITPISMSSTFPSNWFLALNFNYIINYLLKLRHIKAFTHNTNLWGCFVLLQRFKLFYGNNLLEPFRILKKDESPVLCEHFVECLWMFTCGAYLRSFRTYVGVPTISTVPDYRFFPFKEWTWLHNFQ